MADSNVDVTPGTGASIDTRTEATNGNHRQVMVIGDPATNAGVAPVDATTGLRVNTGSDTLRTKLATDVADVTGTITSASSTVTLTNLLGVGGVTVTIYGTYVGVNVTFEAYDGVNWLAIPAQQNTTATPAAQTASGVLTTNSSNRWNVTPLLGCQQFRVRATAWTSGTANVILEPSAQFGQPIVNVATMPTITANLGTGGTAATSLGKAEDAAHATGDTGVAVWGVRNDGAATGFGSANGDYVPFGLDNQGRVYVVQKSTTATLTNITSSTTSATLLAANGNRIGATIYNDSTAALYAKFGATASNTSFTIAIGPNTYYEVPAGYTGIIDGVWAAANGSARVTELT